MFNSYLFLESLLTFKWLPTPNSSVTLNKEQKNANKESQINGFIIYRGNIYTEVKPMKNMSKVDDKKSYNMIKNSWDA